MESRVAGAGLANAGTGAVLDTFGAGRGCARTHEKRQSERWREEQIAQG